MKIPVHIKENPVLCQLWRRCYRYDQNALIAVLGATGSRKSGSSISLGMSFSKNFSLDNVVFLATDFLDLIERGVPVRNEKNEIVNYKPLHRGDVIVWDECGVDNDNTEWFTMKAKIIKWTMNLFRYRNLVVFMTLPTLAMLNVGIRRLIHGALIMKGIPEVREFSPDKFAQAKFVWLNTDEISGKIYKRFPIYKNANNELKQLKPFFISKPPKSVLEKYKIKKDFYSNNWFSLFSKELDYIESKFQFSQKGDSLGFIEKKILESPNDFVRIFSTRKSFNAQLIMDYFNLNKSKSIALASKLNALVSQGKIIL